MGTQDGIETADVEIAEMLVLVGFPDDAASAERGSFRVAGIDEADAVGDAESSLKIIILKIKDRFGNACFREEVEGRVACRRSCSSSVNSLTRGS